MSMPAFPSAGGTYAVFISTTTGATVLNITPTEFFVPHSVHRIRHAWWQSKLNQAWLLTLLSYYLLELLYLCAIRYTQYLYRRALRYDVLLVGELYRYSTYRYSYSRHVQVHCNKPTCTSRLWLVPTVRLRYSYLYSTRTCTGTCTALLRKSQILRTQYKYFTDIIP